MFSVNQYIFPLPIQSFPATEFRRVSTLGSKRRFWLWNWRLWASNPQIASPAIEAFCATPSTISDPIWNSFKKTKLSLLARRVAKVGTFASHVAAIFGHFNPLPVIRILQKLFSHSKILIIITPKNFGQISSAKKIWRNFLCQKMLFLAIFTHFLWSKSHKNLPVIQKYQYSPLLAI